MIRDCKSTNQPRVKDGEPVFPRAWIYCLYIVSLYSRVHMKGRKTVARASLKLWGHFCTNISKPCRGICELSDSFELFRHTFSATRNCFSTFSSSAKKSALILTRFCKVHSRRKRKWRFSLWLMVNGYDYGIEEKKNGNQSEGGAFKLPRCVTE